MSKLTVEITIFYAPTWVSAPRAARPRTIVNKRESYQGVLELGSETQVGA